MALVLADRVQETTTTTGTGTITLAGAVAGFQSFAVVGNGNTTYYALVSGTSWETGMGTYSTTGPTLARTTIFSSSNAGSAITLSGTSNVFITSPASRVPQFYELNSTVAGANATGAQSLLGVGVTLSASTVYAFDGMFLLVKTAGTTSHTVATLFGGTATLNNINYTLMYGYNSASSTSPANGAAINYFSASTAQVFTAAQSTASLYVWANIKGIVSVNAGGTFIPQYALSAAPGGAYTTQIGSHFNIYPIGASGSNISVGTWA